MEIPRHQRVLAEAALAGRSARLDRKPLLIPDLPIHDLTLWALGYVVGLLNPGIAAERQIRFEAEDVSLFDLLEEDRLVDVR